MKKKDEKRIAAMEELPMRQQHGTCCWECAHICFHTAEGGYSEYTPGSDFDLYCAKQHWALDTFEDNETIMGRYLRLAERCPDFVMRPKD